MGSLEEGAMVHLNHDPEMSDISPTGLVALHLTSGSQHGVILSPVDIWQYLGVLLIVTTQECPWHLVDRLQDIPHTCTHTTSDYSAKHVINTENENTMAQ